MPFEFVGIYLVRNSVILGTFFTISGADGRWAIQYFPLISDAGLLDVRSFYPQNTPLSTPVSVLDVLDSFFILSIRAFPTSSSINIAVEESFSNPAQIRIDNSGPTTLVDLRVASLFAVPTSKAILEVNSLSLATTDSVPLGLELPPFSSTNINVTVSSPGFETLSGSTQLRFEASLPGAPNDIVSTVHTLNIQVSPKLASLNLVSILKNGLPASGSSIFTTIQKTAIITYTLEVINVGVASTTPLEPALPEFAASTGFSVKFLASSFPSLAPGESTLIQVPALLLLLLLSSMFQASQWPARALGSLTLPLVADAGTIPH